MNHASSKRPHGENYDVNKNTYRQTDNDEKKRKQEKKQEKETLKQTQTKTHTKPKRQTDNNGIEGKNK